MIVAFSVSGASKRLIGEGKVAACGLAPKQEALPAVLARMASREVSNFDLA